MSDENDVLDFVRHPPHLASAAGRLPKENSPDSDTGEESCPAFGFLRGIKDHALAVELRFRNGNSEWFPYAWLGPWWHNPSVGLLLKFTGDVVTLVLIRGSNLDALVKQSGVNLTDRGFQRHRITFVREMGEDELKAAGEAGPTIDRIEVADFESHDEELAWLKKHAPVFVRKTAGD